MFLHSTKNFENKLGQNTFENYINKNWVCVCVCIHSCVYPMCIWIPTFYNVYIVVSQNRVAHGCPKPSIFRFKIQSLGPLMGQPHWFIMSTPCGCNSCLHQSDIHYDHLGMSHHEVRCVNVRHVAPMGKELVKAVHARKLKWYCIVSICQHPC